MRIFCFEIRDWSGPRAWTEGLSVQSSFIIPQSFSSRWGSAIWPMGRLGARAGDVFGCSCGCLGCGVHGISVVALSRCPVCPGVLGYSGGFWGGGIFEFLRVDEFGSIFSLDAFVMNMITVMICGLNITSLRILVHDTATTRLAPGRDCSVSSVETWTHPGPTRRNPN